MTGAVGAKGGVASRWQQAMDASLSAKTQNVRVVVRVALCVHELMIVLWCRASSCRSRWTIGW
jgi:hypothetical protein